MTTAVELDPFDLPDWLGEVTVCWAAAQGLDGHQVSGRLDGDPDHHLACDLLAVDQAYPRPVLDEAIRVQVHQAWRHGQVLLLGIEERLTLAAPGIGWTTESVLEAFSRFARAVGADTDRWSVRLSLGRRR